MRFPISSMVLIALAGIMLFLFVMFNYAFMGEGGLKEKLRESANKTMAGDILSRFNDQSQELSQMFGIGCVLCFGLSIVFFIVDVFREGRDY